MIWEINTQSQIFTFLYSLIIGSVFCVVYDFLRVGRKVRTVKSVIIFFEDVVFSVFITFFTFLLLLSREKGEIRVYVLLGEIIGFIIFRKVISPFLMRILMFFAKIAGIVYAFIYKTINKICTFIDELLGKLREILKKVIKKPKIKKKTLER